MSIRTFVALTSLLLMLWLAMAYLHAPIIGVGVDPSGAEPEELSLNQEEDAADLTLVTSP